MNLFTVIKPNLQGNCYFRFTYQDPGCCIVYSMQFLCFRNRRFPQARGEGGRGEGGGEEVFSAQFGRAIYQHRKFIGLNSLQAWTCFKSFPPIC